MERKSSLPRSYAIKRINMNAFQKSYAFQIETDLCSHKRLNSCTWDHMFFTAIKIPIQKLHL